MVKTTFKTMPSREICATATAVAERSMPVTNSLSSVSEDPFREEDEPLEEDELRKHDGLDPNDDPPAGERSLRILPCGLLSFLAYQTDIFWICKTILISEN